MQLLTRFFILLLALFLVQCFQKDDDVIVTVGSLTISGAEVKEILKKRYPNQTAFTDLDINVKKDLIEPLIMKKLRVNAAYGMGLDEDKDIKKLLEDFTMRVVGSSYYETVIMDQLVDESEIESALNQQGFELKASHILLGFKGSHRSHDRSKEEALELAKQISQDLKNGADFEEIVLKYSDDPNAKTNKGDLGYFSWGRMIFAFQKTAWDLKLGEISEPVRTQYGYHIIRLEDKKEKEGYTPDLGHENIFRIKQSFIRSYGDSARTLWKNHVKDLEKQFNYKVYEEAINEVTSLLKQKIKSEKITVNSFNDSEREILLAEWSGDKITLGSLIDKYAQQLIPLMGKFRDKATLEKEIERTYTNSFVLQDAEERGITEKHFVRYELQKFMEEQLNKLVEQRHILDKMDATDEQVLDYYQKHPQKFRKGKEIEIWEIFSKDKKKANEILEKAKQGYNFEELAKKYSEDENLKKVGGYMGYKGKNARGTVSRKAHEIGPGGKIFGPINYRRGWSVIKTGGKHEESIKPFDDVKQSAKNMVKYEEALKKRNLWERSLKEEFTVSYDEEKLLAI